MAIQTYYSDVGNGALLFAGYTAMAGVGSAPATPAFTNTATITSNANIPLGAGIKHVLRPLVATITDTGVHTNPGLGQVLAHPATAVFTMTLSNTAGGSSSMWGEGISWMIGTSFPQGGSVGGGTVNAVFGGGVMAAKFFMSVYDSAGIRVATQAATPVTAGTIAAVFPIATPLNVPAGGFVGIKYIWQSNTSSSTMTITQGATAGFPNSLNWNPDVIRILGDSVETRERFNSSNGSPLPDGTKVYEYDSATMNHTGLVGTIGGPIVGTGAGLISIAPAAIGVGEVVFTRAFGDTAEYFYVIPDPSSGVLWTPLSAITLGALVNPPTLAKLVAECTTAGFSAAAEPAWLGLNLVAGDTILDGSVVWTMREVETICTNAIVGCQLGHWTAGMVASITALGPPIVAATRIAPAGTNQYALCSTSGITGLVEPVWPTPVVSGATTITDGTVVWTMFNEDVYK